MTKIRVDVREMSGEPELIDPARWVSVGFRLYSAYVVEDGADDYLLSGREKIFPLVDGLAEPDLPASPAGNGMWVRLKNVGGWIDEWMVIIPAVDTSLWDLPHIDPDSFDPIEPPSPAWIAALAAEQGSRIAGDNALGIRIDDEETTRAAEDLALGAQIDDETNDRIAALLLKADLVDGIVPAVQLPSYVDDVLEFANLAAFPDPGAAGKIYVALDTNLTYRWSGSAYGVLDPSLALGETLSTAYRGDRGKTAFDHSQIILGNPHGTTASMVGFTPSGLIIATDVQAALAELDSEKVSLSQLTTEVDNAVADAASVQMAGLELAYAESTVDFTSTDNATLNTRITGMVFDIVGRGRPVEIKFFCPDVFHSVTEGPITFFLVVDDLPLNTTGQIVTAITPGTTAGEPSIMERRLVLADGVSYNFKVGMFLQVAGTGHAKGDPSAPMYLTATSR